MSIEQNSSYFRTANTVKPSFSEEIFTKNADPFDLDFQSVKIEDNLVLAKGGGGDVSFMTLFQSIFQKC
ncbi:hypothetical protein [Candidatus Rhabdochlamydia porcellionis]|jgi:hypothetical protein|uniref:Uncharacterized protein n=1 Tax=Candidatus Rhabdochlamydia porcellionis TaxID=225148 RepID=A0ABX8YZF0_9BACT|nr:hypothetical protein [Candidatus Rhabdochlamydia porcellionis]QZA58453.1 hypothetical protein RHAB15C_0000327 [Candidatus Rhabdochlamydia porcellionis]